jgi:hypothetical protein
MDYGTLKERIQQMLGRQALTMAYDLASSDLSDTLRIIPMETTVTLTVTGGAITPPADYIAVQSMTNTDGGTFITPIPPERFAAVAGTGAPSVYLVGSSAISLKPAPADGHEVTLVYYARLAELVVDADTNAALDGGALDAFVYSVLAHHATLIRDEAGASFWIAKAVASVNSANRAALRGRYDGGFIATQPAGTVV